MAPRYAQRNGGYTRIVRTGKRQGDNAETAFIELLGAEQELNEKAQKRTEAREKRRAELQKQLEEQSAAEGGGDPTLSRKAPAEQLQAKARHTCAFVCFAVIEALCGWRHEAIAFAPALH